MLLGVNPPGRFVWDSAVVDSQLADWGRMWAASGSPGRSPDLAQTIKTGLRQVPHRWLGRRLDPGKAKILTFALLFQRRTSLIAIDAWEAAARGDLPGWRCSPSPMTWRCRACSPGELPRQSVQHRL